MRSIVLAILLFPSIVFGMTRSDIRDEVRLKIRDTSTTTANLRYTDAQLNKKIGFVEQEIAQATLPIYTKDLIDAVTGQIEYTISTDTIKIDKVVFLITSSTTSYKKLSNSTIQSLDNDKGLMWEGLPNGLPTNYYERGNVIGLIPAPSATYSTTNAIKVYYYKQPQGMGSDSDEPFDSIYSLRPYHYLIVLGASIKCKQDIGMSIADDVALYNQGLQQMKFEVANRLDRQTTITVTK